MRRALIVLVLSAAARPASAADLPEALVVLEVYDEAAPGRVPEAAPPRFVLLKDGQVYVGGTSRLAAGQLDKKELKQIEDRIARVRKLPGLGSVVTLGGPGPRHRLSIRKGRPLDILAAGDPAAAPPALRPLAELLLELSAFYHPSLRPYRPDAYLLRVREGMLDGGCRSWVFGVPLAEALPGGRVIPAEEAEGWPTGAVAASVCAGGKRYILTLRPLLPGERP
jgi:hypothetical protein